MNLPPTKRHGLKNHPLYETWRTMRKRCYAPYHNRFHLYGARNIRICDRWLRSFADFVQDVGEPPGENYSIDRIDVNGHYEPANVKWSTAVEQARNRNNTIMVTLNGEIRPLVEVVEEFGVAYHLVRDRLKRGWNVEAALYHPQHLRPGSIERDCAKAWEKCFPNGSGDCYLR